MYLCARWFRTSARVRAATADSTLSITKSAKKKLVFTFNILEYIYARSCSKCVRAFPTASAMADGTPGIPENTRKKSFYPEYGWMYLRVQWFGTRACVCSGRVSDSWLHPKHPWKSQKKNVFTFNILECIYARSGSECVRAFPAALAIADSTLSINESARKIYVQPVAATLTKRFFCGWPLLAKKSELTPLSN